LYAATACAAVAHSGIEISVCGGVAARGQSVRGVNQVHAALALSPRQLRQFSRCDR